MTDHPSTLALDRLALGAGHVTVQQHVRACDQCRAYLAQVQRDPGPAPQLRPAPWRPALSPWVMIAAAAAALLVAVGTPGLYVGTKGAPIVAVWVRTEEGVHRWSGETLHPGDSVRLEVSPGPYQAVEVRSGGTVLYRGALTDAGALPVSWTLDHAPGPEVLQIVLTGETTPWSLTLEIPKETK